jgi:hypothetical protein
LLEAIKIFNISINEHSILGPGGNFKGNIFPSLFRAPAL